MTLFLHPRCWLVVILCLIECHASASEGISPEGFRPFVTIGHRIDHLDWSVAGPTVNVLSELRWQSLHSTSITAGLEYAFSSWQLKGDVGYARINSGTNQDSDYNGNNRTLEFSRSNNQAVGTLGDYSISVGQTVFQGSLASSTYEFRPLVGFSKHQQQLTMFDGQQTLPISASGPIFGLHNSYNATWKGPWLGAELLFSHADYTFLSTLKLHSAAYSAEADWNLRTEFSHPVSFRHSANGIGTSFSLGVSHALWKNTMVNVIFNAQSWSTGAGIDQTLYANGNVGYYWLNGVNWRSNRLDVGVTGDFLK